MTLWRRFRSFVRNLLFASRVDAELDRELDSYLELYADEHAADADPRSEVQRKALAAMGGRESVKERVRERRVGASMGMLLRDLQFAWRLFWRNAGFSALVVATLALGIGTTTAIFSVVSGTLLRELPYPSPERLVFVAASSREGRRHFSPPDYVDFVETTASFEALAGLQGPASSTMTVGGEPIAARAREVTVDFLTVFGVAPYLGRGFVEADRDAVAFERLGGEAGSLPPGAVMLSYEFWSERFGAARDVVGRLVELEYQPYRVVGVTPPEFRELLPDEGDYRRTVDVYVLSRMRFEAMPRDAAFLRVVGRLQPDIDVSRADAESTLFAERQRGRHRFHDEAAFAVNVLPLDDALGARHAAMLWVLFGAVSFLMLIACANLVNLLLIRAIARRKELAVRVALGSGRLRLARQLVTESFLYATAAVVMGVPLAAALVRVFVRLAPPSIPRIAEVHIEGAVLLFSLAVSFLAAFAVTLVPAVRFSRANEIGMLRVAGRALGGGERRFGRQALVVAEVALSVVLMVGTALFLRTLGSLLAVDPGYRPDGVLTAEMNLPSQRYPRYPRPDARIRFARRLIDGLEDVATVDSAALALVVPLSGQDAGHSYASEAMAATGRLLPPAKYRPVTPGYFEAVGTPLVEGRTFTWDEVEQYRLVSVVDENLAARAWPGESAIGKRLRVERWATSGGPIHLEPLWTEVVGVARDVRSLGLGDDDIETVYLPYGLYAVSELSLLVRTEIAPEALLDSVRAEVARVDPELAVFNYRKMSELVTEALAPERFSLGLLAAFGLTGFLLTLVGVYGVLSHAVSLRRQELGLRLALGASAGEIARMVLSSGAAMIALGVAVGLAAAWTLSGLVASQLYAVTPSDPASYAAAAVLTIAVGLLASAVPAHRASRIDPMKTLRSDL